jgi:HEPN domain-containing protein
LNRRGGVVVFEVEKTIKYWLDGAAYDLETGRSLLESKRFPYALFFGHLSLEKVLKALVVKATQQHALYTHSLTLLASKTNLEIPESILDQLAEFTEFHLESRYPDDKKEFYEKCTEVFANRKFKEMEDVSQWLIRKLEISFHGM